VKSWAGTFPAKPMRRDIATASQTGFYWCLHCRRITEPKDPGDVYQCCTHCGSRRMEWKQAIPDERPLAEPTGAVNPKRLPKEKRDLRLLTVTGSLMWGLRWTKRP
jgi:DNA-directed RNA polymerase subunit RPC12/RpoP